MWHIKSVVSFFRVESMSANAMGPGEMKLNPRIGDSQLTQDVLLPMG